MSIAATPGPVGADRQSAILSTNEFVRPTALAPRMAYGPKTRSI